MSVLLLAALLRIYHLNLQGLWGDEGWSVAFSAPSNPAEVTRNLVDDLHPPFYFILLSLWRQVAGDTELVMRFLAVLAALLTVALVDRIGRDLHTPGVGIIAGLVLALADKHIVLSQEVRHYPLAFMLMAVSSLVFLRWIKQPTRTRTLVYAMLVILCVYTHYYTAMIFIVQIAYAAVALRPWSRVRQLVGIISLSMLAFGPWLLVAIHQLIIRPEGILHSMDLSWDTLEYLAVDFLGRPVVLLGGLLLLGVYWRRHQYATLWFGVPVATTLAVYPFVTVLTDRNMALILVPMALLVAQGIARFQVSAQVFLVFLVTANGLTSLDSYHDHPPWRELSEYIADNYPAGEPVLMDVVGGDKAMGYHLEQLLPDETRIISLNQWRIDFGIYFLGVLGQLLDEQDGFWIAYWVNPDREWDVREPLAVHGYELTATHRDYHLGHPIDLYHYDRIPEMEEVLALYDDRVRLHRVKYPSMVPLGQQLNVSLWWSTAEPLSTKYSVSVFLLDASNVLRAQHDGAPQNGDAHTDSWQVDRVYLDSHRIETSDLVPGEYRLAVKMYDSADSQILPVEGAGEYIVGTVTVK